VPRLAVIGERVARRNASQARARIASALATWKTRSPVKPNAREIANIPRSKSHDAGSGGPVAV
jgi:hypothetical protein